MLCARSTSQAIVVGYLQYKEKNSIRYVVSSAWESETVIEVLCSE